MKWNITIAIVLFFIINPTINGYELATHGAMTQNALDRVLNNDDQLISRLGISLIKDDLGESYYDVSAGAIYERKSDKFERKIIKDDLGVQPLSLPGWLLRGAIREDDLGEILGIDKGADPHDDPYGPFWRVNSHFYDPDLDRSLTLSAGCVSTFESLTGESVTTIRKNPAWALGTGDADAFSNPNTPDSTRRNHYSIKDAREYMYRAVTGQDKDGSKAIVPDGSGGAREPNDNAEAEDARKAYWATTFRALGDIVHLIEDVGQPQHTVYYAGGCPAASNFLLLVQEKVTKEKDTPKPCATTKVNTFVVAFPARAQSFGGGQTGRPCPGCPRAVFPDRAPAGDSLSTCRARLRLTGTKNRTLNDKGVTTDA